MALRYFCAKLSKIAVRIKYSTNSGYLPKNGPSNFITDRVINDQSVALRYFYSEEVINFGRL